MQEDPDGRAVMYLAESVVSACAEVFGDPPRLAELCPNYRVATLAPPGSLAFQDLVGPGAMAIGAQKSLCSGNEDRSLTQEWARAIYEALPGGDDVVGVRYEGAHDGMPCVAVWETAPALQLLDDSPSCLLPTGMTWWKGLHRSGSRFRYSTEPLAARVPLFCRTAQRIERRRTVAFAR
jgi:hypothetical protein